MSEATQHTVPVTKAFITVYPPPDNVKHQLAESCVHCILNLGDRS
jgi:hypothetical protein